MNVEPSDLFRVRSRPRQRREDKKQQQHAGVAPVMVPEQPVTKQHGIEEGGGQNNRDNRLVGHAPRYDNRATLRRAPIANTPSRSSPTVDRKQIVALEERLKVLEKEKATLELANSLLVIENQQVKQECQELRRAVELQEKDRSGASIMEGEKNNLEKQVSSDGYATQESPSKKSKKKSKKKKEKGFKGEQDGDWYCPRNCLGSDTLVFAWRTECFKCRTPRPGGFDGLARIPSNVTDVLEIGQRTMSKSKSAMLSDDDLNTCIYVLLSLSDLTVEVLSILQVGDYSMVHVYIYHPQVLFRTMKWRTLTFASGALHHGRNHQCRSLS